MNMKPDVTIHPANCPAASGADSATAKLEQRAKNLKAFREKYDAMLYIVDFIATFQLSNTGNSRHEKARAELKSLIAEARNGLMSHQKA